MSNQLDGNHKKLNFNIFRAMSATSEGIKRKSATVRNSILSIFSSSPTRTPTTPQHPIPEIPGDDGLDLGSVVIGKEGMEEEYGKDFL